MDFKKKYDFIKIYNNSKESKTDHNSKCYYTLLENILDINLIIHALIENNFDKSCILCISNKQT